MSSHAKALGDHEKDVASDAYPGQLLHSGIGADADGLVETDTASALAAQRAQAEAEGIRPAFYAKVGVLNKAIAEIGMGRYQWELFITAGFGWMADNLWLQAIAIVMPAVANEWIGYPHVRMATLALYAGLIVGAFFWGMSADVVG